MVIPLTGVFVYHWAEFTEAQSDQIPVCLPHFSVRFSQFLQREAKTLLVLQRCVAPGPKVDKLSSIG